jgi:exosortase
MNEQVTTNPPSPAVNAGPSTIGILDEFQTELVDYWGRLPNKGFFFGLLAAWLALFQFLGNSVFGYITSSSLFVWMFLAYNGSHGAADDNDMIGNFIPLVVLGLFWWKRKELFALQFRIWVPALLIIVFAAALHIFGYVAQQPQLSIVAMFIGIYGLTGLAWGWRWLYHSLFPFFLFMFSVPLGSTSAIITVPLQLLVCQLVEWVSHGLGIGVVRAGALLFDPSGSYQYEVAAACSGIRSLEVIFLLATAYGFLVFQSIWKRAVMVAMAVPLAVFGNLIRMMCIIIAAAWGGQSKGDYVHEGGPFGIISLLPYVLTMAGLFVMGGWLEKGFRGKQKSSS